MKFSRVDEIVQSHLCLGCGVCVYACKSGNVELWDFELVGIRPVTKTDCVEAGNCVRVCPAISTDFDVLRLASPVESPPALKDRKLDEEWGRIEGVWEGHATDSEIRYKGSSGGVITALSAYLLEVEKAAGVLHIGASRREPARNTTRLSTNRRELMDAAGSRYAPASVGNGLPLVEKRDGASVVIGKPSEIAGVRKAQLLSPALNGKISATISFFCAETPSSRGTIDLLKNVGGSEQDLGSLRYRGYGWPGHFAPTRVGEAEPYAKMPYSESWKFLQSYRPWSVHIWPDGTGELADISCGDPWYEKPDGENPGFSLVVARTKRGREIVEGAIAAGYVNLVTAEPWKLQKSQQYLADKKAATWGRIFAMRLFLMEVPSHKGAMLFQCWMRLTFKEKIKSVFGTLKRIRSRKLYRGLALDFSSAKKVALE